MKKSKDTMSSSTRPQPLGPVEMIRWVWTQLTSMRTALALLFLLALGAIPGSLIPQRSQSAMKVSDFKQAHTVLDKVYEPLGMYDVYTSPWFSAIYLLLFASLIGCIIPRIRVYWKALRGRPARIPSRLDRLPEHRLAAPVGITADEGLERAEAWLRKRRFRVERTTLPDGSAGLSAERGYLREFGNLLFHLSLVFVLLGIAWNNMLGFKGSTILVEGQGFSNSITQYDEYHAGAWVDTDNLSPFSMKLKQFIVKFETGPVQRGAARDFRATMDVTDEQGTRSDLVRVNHPITIDGNKIHLIGHGYAAHVTVTDGKGDKAWQGPVVFLPQDGNFTSSGVIKAPDARPERLAFQGIFLPTAPEQGMMGQSLFPDAVNPKLFLNAYHGAPKTETGKPENIYALDTTGLTQFKEGDDVLSFMLKPGEGYTLPDGTGTVTFDGWSRWSKVQISRAPGLPMTFGSIAASILGLCLSLFVRPRRLWIRTRTNDEGTAIEVAGLDRADARTGLSEHVDELTAAATGTATEEKK
ncbi:cytochrome c biogenesis protein [Luteococcus japonicus]|uniref:Cytochrome c biogenesis protein n=1 Tax=Luteococcus japonicus TaxID=33984 RepID=A0A3N1ZTW1_9ACTN|nr:cytochrome c biogenesis protein ResB [Luteococcus japonicus]ROR54279.1 cytochrome c biogenesis protein [Luteococcus japonicus]